MTFFQSAPRSASSFEHDHFRWPAPTVRDHVLWRMLDNIPLLVAVMVAVFLVMPMAIIVPMSFSSAISFEFPPPGYWTGYYREYFSNYAWLDATANSFIIASASMLLTLLLALPAAFGYARYRFFGKGAFNLLMLAPIIVP